MNTTETKNIICMAACVCAMDGIISQIELESLYESFQKIFEKKISRDEFDSIIDLFFESNDHIEHYMELISKQEMHLPVLSLAKVSASSDGFVIQENLAYQKALLIWKIDDADVDA